MLTLLGALGGFLTSAVPKVFNMIETRQKNKQQLQLLEFELEAKKQGVSLDLKLFNAKKQFDEHQKLLDHDIEINKGTGFFSGLSKSVRPMITYFFFILFAAVKITHLVVALSSGDLVSAILIIWDEPTQVMFAAIVSFWFGSRVFGKEKTVN